MKALHFYWHINFNFNFIYKIDKHFNDNNRVWLLFNIFIGYIEAKMFLNQNTMSKKKEEYDKNPYFYEKNYSLSELKTDFAVDRFLNM